MLSLWEKRSFLEYDIIIIGAGIVGLSTAASIKEERPELSVMVLERGLIPTGASTKNAGFACFGSLTELVADLEKSGLDNMLHLVEQRKKGLELMTMRLGQGNIDLQLKNGYELLNGSHEDALNRLDEINKDLSSIFTEDVFVDASGKLSDFGFNNVSHLVENRFEGQLDTGKLMMSLWNYCNELGVVILTGAEVRGFESNGRGIQVDTPDLRFKCKSLALCTNAFTKDLVETGLVPGRGLAMSIKPERPLKFQGSFHYDEGYFYFRDFYDHIVFGGGRNLDLENESTTEFGTNDVIFDRLIEDLRKIIIPNQAFEIGDIWSGIMAFGPTKQPILEEYEDGIFLGVRLGGMGVAIGSIVGEELSDLIIRSRY